jgi:type IV fimbrial biogenesis protein FimT
MTRIKGFTLIESLIVVCIAGLLFISGFPALMKAIDQQRLRSASSMLIRSLQVARSTAVIRNATICIANKNSSWTAGWRIFVDTNRNCAVDNNEEILFQQDTLSMHVATVATLHAQDHILYISSGESEQLDGGFQADSIYFCPENNTLKGVRIVVSRGGRVRSEEIPGSSPHCIN